MKTEEIQTGYPSIDKPWLKYYSEESIKGVPQETLYQQLLSSAKQHKEQLAFVDFNTKEQFTYQNLVDEVERFSAALYAAGVRAGQIVALLSFNSPADPITVFSCNKIGAVVKFVDPDSGIEGMASSIQKSDFLVLESFFAEIEPLINIAPIPTVIYGETSVPTRGNCVFYTNFVEKTCDNEIPVHKDMESPALIIYSSGSTGLAKPIIHSNKTVSAAVFKMRLADFPINENNLLVKMIPSHIGLGSITTMITTFLLGASCIQLKGISESVDSFEGIPLEMVSLIRQYRRFLSEVNLSPDRGLVIFGAPFFADFIYNSLDSIEDMSFIKGVLFGGAKMEKDKLELFEKAFGQKGLSVPICNGYGQNEMAGAVALNTVHYNKNGSAGYPVYGTNVKIVDPDTYEELPFNTVGLIIEQSESAFLRYLDLPEKTKNARVVLEDGTEWYNSTDLGYMDEDGFLFITGRTSRVVIRVDHKVSLEAIEEKTQMMECVSDVAAVSPNGSEVVLYVCTTSCPEKAIEMIKSFPGYAKLEVPDRVVVLDKLPRMNNGKVDYRALEQEAKNA